MDCFIDAPCESPLVFRLRALWLSLTESEQFGAFETLAGEFHIVLVIFYEQDLRGPGKGKFTVHCFVPSLRES
jgi:hypothetical protein